MKWPAALHAQSNQTLSIIILLMAVLILNLFNLYISMDDKTSLLRIGATDTKAATQLKQMNDDLQQLVIQLQKSKSFSETSSKTVLAELNTIQTVLNTVPSQANFQQLQKSISLLNTQITKKETAMSEQVHSKKKKSKVRVSFRRHMSPWYLPFQVTSIDVWNRQAQASIIIDGQNDLMAEGETRARWTLVSLSFDPAIAVFKNERGQDCTVRL